MKDLVPNLVIDGVLPEHTKATNAKFEKWDSFVKRGGIDSDRAEDIEEMYELLKDPTIYIYAFFRNAKGEPLKVYPYQDILLNSPHRYIMIPSANQIGKSFFLCLRTLIRALREPGSTHILISRNMTLSKDLVRQIKEFLKMAILDYKHSIGETENKMEINFRHFDSNGKELPESRIIATPANESALSYPANSIAADEFAFYDIDLEYFFYQIMQPRTYATKGDILLISNPNGDDNFYYDLWLGDKFHKYRVTYLDNPNNTKEDFDKLCEDMPKAQIDSTLLARFAQGSGRYFSNEEITGMMEDRHNQILPPELNSEPLYIFLDLAKVNDRTVSTYGTRTKDGGVNVQSIYEYPERTPYNEILDNLEEFCKEYGAENIAAIGFDATGSGLAIEDFIKRFNKFGVRTIPLKYTLQSKTKMYTLLKLLMEKNLRNPDIESGIKMPKNNAAKYQFSQMEFKQSSSGNFTIHHAKDSDRDDIPDSVAGLTYMILDLENVPVSFDYVEGLNKNAELISDNSQDHFALKPTNSTRCECGNILDAGDEVCSFCGKDL